MNSLVAQLRLDYPAITFLPGDSFYWSPRKQSVYYLAGHIDEEIARWALLHELGHALLHHQAYRTDFNLLQLEVHAWQKAESVANNYAIVIDKDHIQDCLDTYRDWLYQRSTCPSCTSCSLQINHDTYRCFNCNNSWRVSGSRKCRPYRKKQSVGQTITA